MGQAWCKEKSTKAQDSKSPLDRVFLRCAHRIYPGLKEEGSVLGGATQRVTSSEIGYASSPPREVLTRGQSIDSVDRPFHPSDWVDVNLEVPITPTSAMTNLTLDTTMYPSTTVTSTNSGGSNLREFAPIPPPRRRKKNHGRPLPPKPDEIARSYVDRLTTKSSKDSRNTSQEPVYSSVKNSPNEKEIFEHKINGTGKIIPSIVVAAGRSNRDKSSRESEKAGEKKNSRPKNNSTKSLPNYAELEVGNESLFGDEEGEIKIHKIMAAGSLPSLITSGVLENLKKNEKEKKETKATNERRDDEEKKYSMDEVDFSFDATKNRETLNSILKLEEGPRITSTPLKNGFENDSTSPTTIGGWFLHQDRTPESDNFSVNSNAEKRESAKSLFYDCQRDSRNEIFFEAEEDQLDQNEGFADNHGNNRVDVKLNDDQDRTRTRTSLRRTLSNESEPFDSCEEKELRDRDTTIVRSNSQVKLQGRTISEESLPQEMLENEAYFFEEKGRIVIIDDEENKKFADKRVTVESLKNDDTKTPPPSPEPKIKPEIYENDHSTLLKVLRDETEDSNLSSMTPSLTELEAALSDMLERDDDQDTREETTNRITMENLTDKFLEKPIEPKILQIDAEKDMKNSGITVSLKNILGVSKKIEENDRSIDKVDDSSMTEIDLTNGGKIEKIQKTDEVDDLGFKTIPVGDPPEKPSRLHQTNHEESSKILENVPTPPRRRNRYSGYSSSILTEQRSLDRTAITEDPYPNDRLI